MKNFKLYIYILTKYKRAYVIYNTFVQLLFLQVQKIEVKLFAQRHLAIQT